MKISNTLLQRGKKRHNTHLLRSKLPTLRELMGTLNIVVLWIQGWFLHNNIWFVRSERELSRFKVVDDIFWAETLRPRTNLPNVELGLKSGPKISKPLRMGLASPAPTTTKQDWVEQQHKGPSRVYAQAQHWLEKS